MEERLCCINHQKELVDRYLNHGQRLTIDTNLERLFGKPCEFTERDSLEKCKHQAKYLVTITARFEIPPFTYSYEVLIQKSEDLKAEFLL